MEERDRGEEGAQGSGALRISEILARGCLLRCIRLNRACFYDSIIPYRLRRTPLPVSIFPIKPPRPSFPPNGYIILKILYWLNR